MQKNVWLPIENQILESKIRLFCLPYAGGSAAIFNSWQQEFDETIVISALQLPGRWERHHEKSFTRIEPLVAELHESVAHLLVGQFAFVCYSFGTLVAFEWIRLLRRLNVTLPAHFFVLSRMAPQLEINKHKISSLSDVQFLKKMQTIYGGISDLIFQDLELREAFLPILKSDMEALENYRYLNEPPINVPITAVSGIFDQSLSEKDVLAWGNMTEEKFESYRLRGGNFIAKDCWPETLTILKSKLSSMLAK